MDAEPGLYPALIGDVFGLLLIYFGKLIPFRVLRWPVVALGVLFVVVMTSYVAVVLWRRMVGHIRPIISKVRGHVRTDPQLGTLTRDMKAHCWVARLKRDDRTMDVVIGGDDEPDPRLLAEARDFIAGFDTVDRFVSEYLAREADKERSTDPEMAAEILTLRISSIILNLPTRPKHVAIEFEGPNEMRYWRCDYSNGKLGRLGFDS